MKKIWSEDELEKFVGTLWMLTEKGAKNEPDIALRVIAITDTCAAEETLEGEDDPSRGYLMCGIKTKYTPDGLLFDKKIWPINDLRKLFRRIDGVTAFFHPDSYYQLFNEDQMKIRYDRIEEDSRKKRESEEKALWNKLNKKYGKK